MFSRQNRWLDIDPVYLLRREVLELRRAVTPLSEPLRMLTAGGNPLVPKEVRRHLRDVDDHLTTVIDRVLEYDDLLNSLLQAGAAKVGIQQTTDMRKISAWVAIAAVPTMVAGIYGMNFDHMPELHQPWGYPLVLGVLVAVCGLLFVVFRRSHWL